MDKIRILWADDEIELLKPHVLFLQEKGYEVDTANSGDDALDLAREKEYDIVFLDENMPGLSGLETLSLVKQMKSDLPVVMITKSEEEHIMEDAIGSQISDYLIKPVNPNQILLSIKKNLENKRLIREKTSSAYQQEFRAIGMRLGDRLNFEEWKDIYQKLVFWELELSRSKEEGMEEILRMQKSEANIQFNRYVIDHYQEWLNGKDPNPPLLSHTVFKQKVVPEIDKHESTFLVLIDNLRYDQWKVIQPVIAEYFRLESEDMYCSILPTATQYARNAFFAGLLPSEIEKRHPNHWLNDEEEGGKNLHEEFFMQEQLKRIGKDVKSSYHKITNIQAGKKLADNIPNLMGNRFNAIVYNFVDMLSHARTEMEVIRELADNEKAYRSITVSWLEHSPLLDILRQISQRGGRLIITTDHGTIRVTEPSRLVGDRNTNTNLRYKQGKNLSYEKKDVFEIKNPQDIFLPRQHVSTAFVFAREDKFFAYPNNYNYFVNYYRNTFQHGGISLEEMLIPFAILSAK
jgi:DNA-binding response OmpR family regulator